MKRKSSNVWEEYDVGFKKGNVVGCGLIVPPRDKAKKGKKAHAFLTVNGVACEYIKRGILL